MDNGDNALIPRSVVFDEARGRDLAPSDDRFDRFRAGGLIGDLGPIHGTTQRGFTPAQAQRFFDLLSLCKQLGSKRPRASALAFWLCWYGATNVPAKLVCEHIERSVLSYIRFIGRQYDRRRVPYRKKGDPERWRKAGIPWAKPFIKEFLRQYVHSGLLLDIMATVVGLALRILFSDSSFEAAAAILKRLAFLFGAKEANVAAMRTLWEIAREGIQLFTTNEQSNPLLNAVREIKAEDPSQIVQQVHDARLAIAVMGTVFPTFNVAMEPAVPESNSEAQVTAMRNFPPGMCAVMALTRRTPHAIEVRERLRAGDTEAAVEEFRQIQVIRDTIITHISKEPKA
jgi:hypothetical protein